MVRFNGEKHTLHESMWGGEFCGYLHDGLFYYDEPNGAKYLGYIVTSQGVIGVYRSRPPWKTALCILLVVLAMVSLTVRPPVIRRYQVSFAESPVLEDDILYCSVVNVSDRELTVNFTDNDGHDSMLTLLRPGETLPVTQVDFVPTAIVYDQKYQFELEVQYD